MRKKANAQINIEYHSQRNGLKVYGKKQEIPVIKPGDIGFCEPLGKNWTKQSKKPPSGAIFHNSKLNYSIMHDITAYISEAEREIAMRLQVYPGRVKLGKMTQAAADRKTELMRGIKRIFEIAQGMSVHPQDLCLPINVAVGSNSPFLINTLEPHIKEADQEIQWREHLMAKNNYGRATKQVKQEQLAILREILEHLRAIQNHAKAITNSTLF